MPASAVLVAALAVTWPLFGWPLRRRFGPRAWMVPPLASLALLPFVALVAAASYSAPLVDVRTRCGLGELAFFVCLIPCVGGALGAGTVWARYVAAPPGRRRADATLRTATVAALAGAAVLVGCRLPGLGRPDADGWASSLPVAEDPPAEVTQAAFEHFAWSFFDVRHDPVRGLWVVTRPEGGSRAPVLVLGPALVPRTVRPRDLEDIGPPHGWVLEGAGGVLAGAFCVAAGLWLARTYARRRSGVTAFHRGHGWVSVGDELAPVHLPALQASAAGPVVVRVVAGPAATYRGTGAPSSVRLVAVGTPESVSDSARSIATVGFVMALAIVALACAPLAVVT